MDCLKEKMKFSRFDIAMVFGLLLLTSVYTLHSANFSLHPFEDAAMLMHYANHLAQGHGIVWNIGEKPVDGATDFLFMVFLAGLVKIGLSIEIATRWVIFLSHLITVLLIYIAIRELHDASPWIATLSASYLAMGPGTVYISSFFGAPFFALSVCITWYLANKNFLDMYFFL